MVMPIDIPCPSCRMLLRAAEEHRGRQTVCPGCKNPFTIPAAAPPPVAVAITATPSAPAAQPPDAVTASAPHVARPEDFDPAAITNESPTAARVEDDGAPTLEPAGKTDAAPLTFTAWVEEDSGGRLKRGVEARVTTAGVAFGKGDKEWSLPRGGLPARYLGKNRVRVESGGRSLVFAVNRFGWYQQRLARDLVAFLNGGRAAPRAGDYRLEWYLLAVALLPIGIPILTRGGAIWGALGGGLTAVCLGVVQVERMSRAVRLTAALGLALAGYAPLLLIALTALRGADGQAGNGWPRLGGLRDEWQTVRAPRGILQVEMPGEPTPRTDLPLWRSLCGRMKHLHVEFTIAEVPGMDKPDIRHDDPSKGTWASGVAGMLANQCGGRSDGVKELTFQGHKVWEYQLSRVVPGRDGPVEGEGVVRFYHMHTHGCMVMAVGPDFRRAEEEVQRFFNSVRFAPGRPPPEPVALELGTSWGILGEVQDMEFSPDGEMIGVVHYDSDEQRVSILRLETGQFEKLWTKRDQFGERRTKFEWFRFAPGRKGWAIGEYWGGLVVSEDGGEPRRWELPAEAGGHPPRLHSLAYSPDGQWLASLHGDGKVRLFARGALEPKQTYHITQDKNQRGNRLAWSPDGRWLAAGGIGEVKVWEVSSGAEKTILEPHAACVSGLAFSPDGRFLAFGFHPRSGHKGADVIDTSTWTRVERIFTWDPVLDVRFSGDGRWLGLSEEMRGTYLYSVGEWDLRSKRFGGHYVFSPDSKYLVTGGRSGPNRGDSIIRMMDLGPLR